MANSKIFTLWILLRNYPFPDSFIKSVIFSITSYSILLLIRMRFACIIKKSVSLEANAGFCKENIMKRKILIPNLNLETRKKRTAKWTGTHKPIKSVPLAFTHITPHLKDPISKLFDLFWDPFQKLFEIVGK
jgi:hypothetical protein